MSATQQKIDGHLRQRHQLEIDLGAYKIRVRDVEGRIRALDGKIAELTDELIQEQAAHTTE